MKFSVQTQKVRSVLDVRGKSEKVSFAFPTDFSTDGVKLKWEEANNRLLILCSRDAFQMVSATQRLCSDSLPPFPAHYAII